VLFSVSSIYMSDVRREGPCNDSHPLLIFCSVLCIKSFTYPSSNPFCATHNMSHLETPTDSSALDVFGVWEDLWKGCVSHLPSPKDSCYLFILIWNFEVSHWSVATFMVLDSSNTGCHEVESCWARYIYTFFWVLLFCVGRSLAIGLSPIQGVLQNV
jgi:hypothetical protein